MSYITVTLNHFRSLQLHAQAANVEAKIDVASFRLELKGHGRYFTLYPLFLNKVQKAFIYSPRLSKDTVGFIGWLPYQPVSWRQVSDKLQFKQLLAHQGLRTPCLVENPGRSEKPYIVKSSIGSFGYGLRGPFRADLSLGEKPTGPHLPNDETEFAEEFVPGTILKAWFWGDEVFFAHSQEYPTIVGDGARNVRALIEQRMATIGESFEPREDQQAILSCLAFQQVTQDTVLDRGKTLWIDYRYGRGYASVMTSVVSDSVLSTLPAGVKASLNDIGSLLGQLLVHHFGAPMLYSVDGVIDAAGEVWWLEANTNPMLPPDGYQQILSTLFNLKLMRTDPSPAKHPHPIEATA